MTHHAPFSDVDKKLKTLLPKIFGDVLEKPKDVAHLYRSVFALITFFYILV